VPHITPATSSDTPERKCILSGVHGTPEELLRLALGPEGEVGADFAAKLPGRGAWLSLDRAALETAIAKGKFKAALARAFKLDGKQIRLDDGFADTIARGLKSRALSRLGLEKKGGVVVSGSDQVETALRKGKVWLVIHAGDAADDGMRKLRGGPEPQHRTVQIPCSRDELGLALGRDAVVHAAVLDSAAARRCLIDIRRWLAYGATTSASTF
jgi:uncharacterized protein